MIPEPETLRQMVEKLSGDLRFQSDCLEAIDASPLPLRDRVRLARAIGTLNGMADGILFWPNYYDLP